MCHLNLVNLPSNIKLFLFKIYQKKAIIKRMVKLKEKVLKAEQLILCLITGTLMVGINESYAAKGIQFVNYNGWQNSIIIEANEAEVEVVIVPAIGGRIMRYELYGDSILYENKNAYGITLEDGGNPFFAGGYQFDIGPENREYPASVPIWLGKWEIVKTGDYSVHLKSVPDPKASAQLEKEIVVDPENGEIGIVQRIRNISDRELDFSHWDKTVCRGGGFIIMPLSKSSKFPAGWTLRRKVENIFVYDGIKPSSPNVRVLGKFVVGKGDENAIKIGSDSDAGWIAYVLGTTMFVKYFPVEKNGNYESGNVCFAFLSDRIVEFGPVSPKKSVKPGEPYDFPEKWTLIQLKEPVTDFKQAKSAAEKIPPSPFNIK